MPSLTIVVPAYNEAASLPAFHARLCPVLDGLVAAGMTCDVLYVDDGSRDGTWQQIEALAGRDRRVRALRLSRNFGKELALTAGLDHVHGDAALTLDADLQHPPEAIPAFVRHWQDGCDLVYGVRNARAGEGPVKRSASRLFYRVFGRVSDTAMPRDAGDFRLLSRPVLDALGSMRERQRFMKGLFAWVGFRQQAVPYEEAPRVAGRSTWNYWRLWNFALEAITSFSTLPLRIATYAGLLTSLCAFLFGLWVLGKALAYGDPVRGYPSLMVVMLFLGGVQLMALGVIGEYLGRLYLEAKQRPLYLVAGGIGAGFRRAGTVHAPGVDSGRGGGGAA